MSKVMMGAGVRTLQSIAVAVALVLTNTAGHAQQASIINRGVVELETSGSDGISVRVAEDLASIFNDGAARRLIPVVGTGSLQNIADLKYLHGIDLAIVQTDVLNYAKERNIIPSLSSSISYISKLYNEEFHLLARRDIKNLSELSGQKVNVDVPGSGTAITAERLFDILKVSVTAVHDNQQVALSQLRSGKIAALAFVAGKPAPFFKQLTDEDGFHLISLPLSNINDVQYAPARLTAKDYPQLIKPNLSVDTIAVGSIMLAADLRQLPDRYNNVSNFVNIFFTNFNTLLSDGYHSKWDEVNLATDVVGWRRYEPAQQWLERNPQVAGVQDPDKLRVMFSRFIDERRQAMGTAPMTDVEKNTLFQEFQSWRGDAGH
jgi:uncharacterized protein